MHNVYYFVFLGDEEKPPARQVGILDETPGGSRYWIPDVINKPVESTIFESVQHAYQVYKEYAKKVGLKSRKVDNIMISGFVG